MVWFPCVLLELSLCMSWLYLLQMLHVCVGVFHSGVQNVSERRGWQHDLASMTEGAYAEIRNPTDGLISLRLTWVELVHVVGCSCCRYCMFADGVFHSGVQNLSEMRGWQHDLASMTEGAYAEIKNPTDGLISLRLTWVELVHVLALFVADVACFWRRFPQRFSEFVGKERMTTWLSQHDWGRICWDKKIQQMVWFPCVLLGLS